MFSPAVNNPPASVRSSRRRQRPLSNEGSIAQPKAKRQRSALNEQTFVPPNDEPEMEDVKSLKLAALAKQGNPKSVQSQPREIVLRARKSRSGDRSNKGDGSVVLTSNDTYTVSKLPALPDRLRADVTGRQHGAVFSESGYALSLTHTHAIVWPYTAGIPSPETFTFALPSPSKHASDPLPLGSLVTASASSSEPGLVVVIPTTGKVTCWESIASAATLDLRLQRNGVELIIPGMLSGETVIQLLNAESAGFVLAFSSGRIAYMSVRDGQGRPAISVQFFRGSTGPASSGIFGSIRHALSSSAWRGDVAAVRASRQEKVGERNVVVATATGKIECWNIHRGGHHVLQVEEDGRDAMVMAMKQAVPALAELHIERFEVHDFTYTPKSVADTYLSEKSDDGVHLLFLVSLSGRQLAHYSLVEVVLQKGEIVVGTVRPIKSYTNPVGRETTSKPRLYLPNPGLVAYVVFARAVVVLSMARQPDSPDLQLQMESHLLPQTFEDVVDFREDVNVEIVGSGIEEPHRPTQGLDETKLRRHKAKYPAVVLLVRGGGVVRVAATDINKLASSEPPRVTARSKLEQAVFFGSIDMNPLSFGVRPELQFSADEVGAAALKLSDEILASQTKYISSVTASIEQNLQKRSSALRTLAQHLKSTSVALDRVTRWQLLWNAEKMAGATKIWKGHDERLRSRPSDKKRGLLNDLVESVHESRKTEPVPELGETDRIRHWFMNDIGELQSAIPWAYGVIKYAYQDGEKALGTVAEMLLEANDIVIGALKGAFDFRTDNLELYGLHDEILGEGILEAGYEGLPEFWTSAEFLMEGVRKQADVSSVLLKPQWGAPATETQLSTATTTRLCSDIPLLIDLYIRTSTERVRWDAVQESHELRLEGEHIKAVQEAEQEKQLQRLANEFGLAAVAMSLAERHKILPTLAALIVPELKKCADKLQGSNVNRPGFETVVFEEQVLEAQVNGYFEMFGTSWATSLYEHYIQMGEFENLLNDFQNQRAYLTPFLRSKPEYARVAWMHEVFREHDFERAANTLLDLGLRREQDVWSKKIELSVGKLASLASHSPDAVPEGLESESPESLSAAQNELELIKIQDEVYSYVRPSIDTAVDEGAETQLALETHGNKKLNKLRALSSVLEESMARLVNHEAMDALSLIDLLTLMDGNTGDLDGSFRGQQFYLALRASLYGIPNLDELAMVQRLIWRRCMLRDNWAEVNNTDLKDDNQVSNQLRSTSLYMTLRVCFKNRLFEKDSRIKPMSPEHVVGAGVEELDHRFKGLDVSIRERIMRDMQNEDDALKPYIDNCQLSKWYQGALELARQDFTDEVAEETNDGERMSQMAEALQEVERSIADDEKTKVDALLHSKSRFKVKVHGKGSFRASSKQH